MPRPRRPGAPEPKRRSRKGCWPCKGRKVKCGEEKPSCLNCRRQKEPCDYSIRLNWGGRTRRTSPVDSPSSQSSGQSRRSLSFNLSPPALPQAHLASPVRPLESTGGLEEITAQDEAAESLLWDAALAREVTIGTSYPSRLHDIQDTPTASDQSHNISSRTPDKDSVETVLLSQVQEVAASWPDLSAQMPASLSTVTSPSISELPNFNLHAGPIYQPMSFVRPAAEAPRHWMYPSPCEHDNHDNHGHSPSAEVFIGSVLAECDNISPPSFYGAYSPGSIEASSITSGLNQDQDPDSFFETRILDDGLRTTNHAVSSSSYALTHGLRSQFEEQSRLSSSEKNWQAYLNRVSDNYGVDCGRPDMDLGRNDDHSSIDINYALRVIQLQTRSQESSPGIHPEGMRQVIGSSSKYDYYTSPVPVDIPRYLSPLPPTLVKTPINLMYFHHFLNHTAKILVPHDCENNPFRSVLPSMAIGDPNLLNLMLAYSASHRARYLGHPEPANRIALWVSDVFPFLRLALEDPQGKVTDSHLATAIMLLSLKIVSPSTFEVPIPWQSHLKLARDVFIARRNHMAYPGNRVGAFLTRWLGYLDILGSLSSRHHQPPLIEYYSLLRSCCADEEWKEYAVDCFTGFTPRTGLFLMQLGDLVYQCDNERFDQVGAFIPDWRPSSDVVLKAEALIADFEALNTHVHVQDGHFLDSEVFEVLSVDRAFRYAGLLHLRRRALGDSARSNEVMEASNALALALAAISPGAAVEVGALFPMFTAGCEALGFEQRLAIKERLEVLERTGMKQVQNARTLMQRCWDTDLPWIAVAQGEFLG